MKKGGGVGGKETDRLWRERDSYIVEEMGNELARGKMRRK
jgi:hypothetical protein